MATANPHFPFFDLVVRTPRVELRYPSDVEVVALADLAAGGIHDPASSPFTIPWTDVEPPLLQQQACRYFWRCRAELGPEHLRLPMAVYDLDPPIGEGPTLVGVQDLQGDEVPIVRRAASGSWLGRAHQGRGLGKEMRAAILHLGFEGLGLRQMTTSAWADNEPSLGVTRSLPYRPNGEHLAKRGDVADRHLDFLMERADWERVRRDDITVAGLAPCLPVLGLGSGTDGAPEA